MLRSNAELAVAELGSLSGLDSFGYDEQSVDWVEGYIERLRANWPEGGAADKLVTVLGSYLGEAIIRSGGGTWDENDRQGLGVRFPSGDWCFPFSKVAKQLAEGVEGGESIASFYRFAVEHVATGDLCPSEGDS